MPRQRAGRDIMVGVVVCVGLVLFGVAVLLVSKESRLFQPKVRYWSRFSNTSGLTKGSPVRLVGVQVGAVEEIAFPTELEESRIKVTYSVDRAFAPRIRAGTVAYLKSLSYLSQDKYIELTPGASDQPQLEANAYIEAGMSGWEQTLQQSQSIADDVKEITASLRELLVAMNRGQGIVQEMIHNPEFGRAGVADMEGSLAALRRLIEGLERGQGLAGALLTDKEFSRRQKENIDAALTHLNNVTARLDNPDGIMAQLTDPGGKGPAMMEDLRQGTAALRRAAEGINSGKGLVGRMVHDDAYADSLLKKIDSVAGHADSILGKIDRGEGSIGGLVNDPEVYESLKDIVAGIEKSRVGKGVIRHYGKKGAKTRPDEATGEEEPPPSPTP